MATNDQDSSDNIEPVANSDGARFVITVDAINKILETTQQKQASRDSVGFPNFDPDHSRIDVHKWCTDIDVRVQRDGMENFDIIPRVQASLLGRAKAWYNKYGFQHYGWTDLRAALIHSFASGSDIVELLRKVANTESNEFSSYSDFVMEKICQINRLPFDIPENKIVKIVVGCITDISLRNSLTFVMPSNIQNLIDQLSSVRENPVVKPECTIRRPLEADRQYEKSDKNLNLLKRKRIDDDRRCYKCGKTGHVRAKCTEGLLKKNTNVQSTSIKADSRTITNMKCSFCEKLGHEENTCWAKQRAERKNVNICDTALSASALTPVIVNGQLFHCVLDTGADCSLIREDVADKLPVNRNTHFVSLMGIGTEPILVTTRLEALVEFEEVSVEVGFCVVDSKHLRAEMIIGKDVLEDPSLMIVANSAGSCLIRSKSVLSCKHQKFQVHTVELSPTEVEKLNSVLTKYAAHFITGFPIARVTTGSLDIRLMKETVISYRPYRMAYSERQITKEIIADLLSNGIIRESHSPYSSPMILVKKKNGQNRLCVDYRALNRVTIKDRYPLPRIDDQLDELAGNSFFTSLDMASGFHQIPIADDSVEKTAFVTPDGHYEYLCMPFGLANAPAVFQRAINVALGQLRGNIALVYLDDVLIASKTIDEGLKKLEIVLRALVDSGFSLNLSKCKFLQTTLEYLGREVSANGVRPSKSKIDALVNSKTPNSVKQVRQFMGLANYFRKFVPEFASKTSSITALTKINVPFVWSEECQAAKQYIVDHLTSRPLLVLFNPDLPTELHTDASALGYGAILFQRLNQCLHVVAYYSQATKSYEAKYHSYELETLAVVNSIKHFRHYLLGVKFLVVTDCNALKATKEKRDLLPRVARWWIYLQDFQFDVVYRKGKTLSHADYLSRNIPNKNCYQVSSLPKTWMHVEQQNDMEAMDIINKIKHGDPNATAHYSHKSGILYKKVESELKIYVPRRCRLDLMRRFHEDNCHVGWEKTLAKMKVHFWMPHMTRNVRKFVDSCVICLVAKRPSGKKQCELHPIEKKAYPFDTVHADFMGPFDGKEYRYICIIIDAFTKFVILLPCKTLQAPETVETFYKYVMLFGAPRMLVTDRGTNFTSTEFKGLCASFGIEHHLIAAGASRANGQVERYVDTVSNLLRTNLETNNDWNNYVNRVQLALNTTVNKTIGYSPLQVLTGITGRTLSVGALLKDLEVEPQFEDLEAIRSLVSERAEENAKRMKVRFDATKCKPTTLKIGEKVLYCSNQIRKSKLQTYYNGPYEIVGILPNDRYKLKKGHLNTVIVAARECIRQINQGDVNNDMGRIEDVSGELLRNSFQRQT